MKIIIDEFVEVTQNPWGVVTVKCVGVMGPSEHHIKSQYDAFAIGRWLFNRMRGIYNPTQNAFPKMNIEDRGFLESGITPSKWAEIEAKENKNE